MTAPSSSPGDSADARSYRIWFAVDPDAGGTHPLAAACGVGHTNPGSAGDTHRFDALFEWARTHLSVVDDPADADVAVYAHGYRLDDTVRKAMERARAASVPLLFFRSHDDVTPADPPYGTVWRDSILASRMTPAERALPAFVGDPYESDEREADAFVPMGRPDRASVGFCGYVSSPLRRALLRMTGRREKVRGLGLRARCLSGLERAGRRGLVRADFIRRDSFWAGAAADAAAQRRARRDFVRNILDNPYTLCLRGAGNFSFRLYQVLSFGRIPLFVNTDCALPFADEVDWRSVFCWAEEADMPRLGEVVADHFASLDADAFEAAQSRARRAYLDYIEPRALYERILRQTVNTIQE